MAALDIPILFFHGDADTFVPLHHSERNLAACRHEQRLIVIPGAEHAMAAQVDPERYRRELLVILWRNTNYLWAARDKPLKCAGRAGEPPRIQKQSLKKSTVRCSFLRLKIFYT